MKSGRETVLPAQIRREREAGLSFVEGISRERFLADPLARHAVAMSLVIIGEPVAKLLQTNPDFAAANSEIPWGSVVRMRNWAAHGYHRFDFEDVWDAQQSLGA